MDHKARALAPFKGQSMDRFPMWYGASPETTKLLMKHLGTTSEDEALYTILDVDYKTIRPRYIGPQLEKFDDGSFMSEWGVKRGGYHVGMSLSHPLVDLNTAREVEEYKHYPNPDHFDCKISDEQKEWAKDRCLIGATWAPFFHDSMELVGMEKLFMEMYYNPAFVEAVIEKVFEFYYEVDRRTFEQNPGVLDMYFIGNDFGSQRALLISPDMWRRFYKPYLKKLMDQAKRAGCVTAVHSCGDIHEVIPDLIEVGVDAINPIQVNAENMDPQTLVNEYGNDVVFFGGIDENHILLNESPEKVREETRRIIDILGSRGKYIVAASHDYLLPEIPSQNIVAMFDEAKKYRTGKLKLF